MNLTILLAEDDDDDILFFKEALYEINKDSVLHVAANGIDTIKKLDEMYPALPHCVFIDLNMPVMTGMECLEKIKSKNPVIDIPVFILTTSGDIPTRMLALQKGADGFFTKPSSAAALKIILNEAIRLPGYYTSSEKIIL